VDVSGLSPEEAVSKLKNELVYMTRLKDKFVKNLNDTRKQMVYVEEEAKLATQRKTQLEEQVDEFYLEISNL
jgi:hypothetical protein